MGIRCACGFWGCHGCTCERTGAGLSVLQTVDLLTEQSSLEFTENGLKQRKYPVGENALLMSEESGQTALS